MGSTWWFTVYCQASVIKLCTCVSQFCQSDNERKRSWAKCVVFTRVWHKQVINRSCVEGPNKPARILIKGFGPPLKVHNLPGRSLSEAEKDTHAHSWRVASWHWWDLDLKRFSFWRCCMFNLCAHTCTWSCDKKTHRIDWLLTLEREFFAAVEEPQYWWQTGGLWLCLVPIFRNLLPSHQQTSAEATFQGAGSSLRLYVGPAWRCTGWIPEPHTSDGPLFDEVKSLHFLSFALPFPKHPYQ